MALRKLGAADELGDASHSLLLQSAAPASDGENSNREPSGVNKRSFVVVNKHNTNKTPPPHPRISRKMDYEEQPAAHSTLRIAMKPSDSGFPKV